MAYPGGPWAPAGWRVWSLPPAVLALVLAVDGAAALSLLLHPSDGAGALPPGWGWTLAALLAAGVVSTEATIGVERLRTRSDDVPDVDVSSVWAFAAAVLLPPGPACAVVVGLYAHTHLRVGRRRGLPPHRWLFNTATVVLAVQAAGAVVDLRGSSGLDTPVGLVFLLLGLLAHAAVNMSLVVAVIALNGPGPQAFLQVLTRGGDAVLELATLSMGALAAAAVATYGSTYALLALPPLIVLHRTVLVRQLEAAASTDGKTGLLNAAAWHVLAGRALAEADRVDGRAALLVLDLDHFKDVNDRYGHLVGDHVLAAVAAALRAEVRDDDVVGRFGGEEFVVLLPGVDGGPGSAGARAVAERIRRRIAALRVEVAAPEGVVVVDGLTVSIGGATSPSDGRELRPLLEVADTAMYTAKSAGRNTVRMGAAAAYGDLA
jgi:diguanylate cyclase (GGDEF)-like protein